MAHNQKIIIFLTLLFSYPCFSQFQLAEFDGGEEALKAYIDMNLNSPKNTPYIKDLKLQIKIDSTGKVYEWDILNSINYEIDEAALKMAKNMPKWNPATQNGLPVKSTLVIPIQIGDAPVYTALKKNPEFPGGTKEMYEFINSQMEEFKASSQELSTTFIKFIVDEYGEICCTEFMKPTERAVQLKILRIIDKMPLWIPGEHNKERVKVYFTIPIWFQIP
jgi:hypothetical protein